MGIWCVWILPVISSGAQKFHVPDELEQGLKTLVAWHKTVPFSIILRSPRMFSWFSSLPCYQTIEFNKPHLLCNPHHHPPPVNQTAIDLRYLLWTFFGSIGHEICIGYNIYAFEDHIYILQSLRLFTSFICKDSGQALKERKHFGSYLDELCSRCLSWSFTIGILLHPWEELPWNISLVAKCVKTFDDMLQIWTKSMLPDEELWIGGAYIRGCLCSDLFITCD